MYILLVLKYKVSMRREVATTQSHAEEMKNPINCIDTRAKLLRAALTSVISGVPVEYQKVIAKVPKIFLSTGSPETAMIMLCNNKA